MPGNQKSQQFSRIRVHRPRNRAFLVQTPPVTEKNRSDSPLWYVCSPWKGVRSRAKALSGRDAKETVYKGRREPAVFRPLRLVARLVAGLPLAWPLGWRSRI